MILAFLVATSIAFLEISEAKISHLGLSLFKDKAIAPVPVPKSKTLCLLWSKESSMSSIIVSVYGLGTRTEEFTNRSRFQKPFFSMR